MMDVASAILHEAAVLRARADPWARAALAWLTPSTVLDPWGEAAAGVPDC